MGKLNPGVGLGARWVEGWQGWSGGGSRGWNFLALYCLEPEDLLSDSRSSWTSWSHGIPGESWTHGEHFSADSSVCPMTHDPTHPFTHLSTHPLAIHPSAHPFLHPSFIHLSIYGALNVQTASHESYSVHMARNKCCYRLKDKKRRWRFLP